MGAARKTGKRQEPAPASSEPGGGVAPDRVTHVEVGPEHAGQRLDNFLIRLAKGVPKSHVYRIVRSGGTRTSSPGCTL